MSARLTTVDAVGNAAESADLGIQLVRAPDQLVVRLIGEVDMSNAAKIPATVHAAAGDVALVVLDLTELRFADSAYLHATVSTAERLAEEGKRLAIRNAPEHARRLLELAQLTHLLD